MKIGYAITLTLLCVILFGSFFLVLRDSLGFTGMYQ